MKYLLYASVAVGALIALDFGLTEYGVIKFGFFAPKVESIRRNTFEQSRAYNEGMAQELQQFRLDYTSTTDPQMKAVLKNTIQHRIAGLNPDNLNDPELASWVRSMQQ